MGLPPESVDAHPALIKTVVRGYIWRTELMNGAIRTVDRLVKKVRFPQLRPAYPPFGHTALNRETALTHGPH